MKKYFKFLSLVTIIAIVASVSVIAPLTANAGSLTDIQISLSSYDVSVAADVLVNMTAEVTLATTLSGTNSDEILITFNEYETNLENQFLVDELNLVAGDVTLTCGAADLAVGAVTSDDGDGSIPGYIEITTAAGSDVDVCNAISVLKIEIANSRIRTPYTVDNPGPSGYRIRIDTLEAPYDPINVIDSGTAAVFINEVGANEVIIFGLVDPVLTMSITDGTNPTNSCDLGVLTKDAYRSCSYVLLVGTNADLGYSSSIRADGDLNDDISGALIQKESYGAAGNPLLGVESNGLIDMATLLSESEYGVGIHTSDTADFAVFSGGAYATCANIQEDTAPLNEGVAVDSLTTSDQVFAHADGPVNADTSGVTTLCHVARISGDQPSGSFTQTITITVVGNF